MKHSSEERDRHGQEREGRGQEREGRGQEREGRGRKHREHRSKRRRMESDEGRRVKEDKSVDSAVKESLAQKRNKGTYASLQPRCAVVKILYLIRLCVSLCVYWQSLSWRRQQFVSQMLVVVSHV